MEKIQVDYRQDNKTSPLKLPPALKGKRSSVKNSSTSQTVAVNDDPSSRFRQSIAYQHRASNNSVLIYNTQKFKVSPSKTNGRSNATSVAYNNRNRKLLLMNHEHNIRKQS